MKVSDKLRACISGGDRLRSLGVGSTASVMDNLRAVFGGKGIGYGSTLEKVADAIDVEESGMRDFCERLNRLADAREEMDLFGQVYVPLPKDADGVPIRVGDVVENLREDLEPPLHHIITVYSIQFRAYQRAWSIAEDGYPSIMYRAHELRHYHKPTVEDVLREFALAIDPSADVDVAGMEAIAEYADKVREVVADD